jgi:hypothetical protein
MAVSAGSMLGIVKNTWLLELSVEMVRWFFRTWLYYLLSFLQIFANHASAFPGG